MKKIKAAVSEAFRVYGNCIQFKMGDLGKIFNAGESAGIAGQDITQAVKDAIQQYRQN